jgi:hypothetical protein
LTTSDRLGASAGARPAAETYDLAFETVGNATLIVHDRVPVLATDPWLEGAAYFGSWGLTHEIPAEQLASIRACPYVWISHGHPDHLSMQSLATLDDPTILLPDHVGGRIRDALERDGYRVVVLPDREWVPLTRRVRILSIADPNQDGVLLVDLDGTLVIDANDARDRGWGRTVRRAAASRRTAFLLALAGYGDADMINYFDDGGNRIPPRAARRIPPGPAIDARLRHFGARAFVPFASFHRYEREDSAWANEHTVDLDDFGRDFPVSERSILPAFVRYDCNREVVTPLDPPERPLVLHPPEEFGDDWSEPLTPNEVELARAYFGAITSLHEVVDTVVLRVGREDTVIPIGNGTGRSVRFEAPRTSLVRALRWSVFDDLLIGNFMRTVLIGDWHTGSLHPDFSDRVAKFADNGGARSAAELRSYHAEYVRRAPLDHLDSILRRGYRRRVHDWGRRARAKVTAGSPAHTLGRAIYGRARR